MTDRAARRCRPVGKELVAEEAVRGQSICTVLANWIYRHLLTAKTSLEPRGAWLVSLAGGCRASRAGAWGGEAAAPRPGVLAERRRPRSAVRTPCAGGGLLRFGEGVE